MDWATIISIAGIVGTWITILLVLFTLLEMRNQRKASQKPDLVIPKASIYGHVHGIEGQRVFIPRYWSNDEHLKDEYVWPEGSPIKLYNVGFGVAKNIELRWIVKYDKALQQIKDYCYQNSVPMILKSTDEGFHNEEAQEFVSFSPNIFKHDFLMPVSITSEGLVSRFPTAVKELISILVYLKSHYHRNHISESTQLEIEIPSMTLEVHYEDMENSHYRKRFEVTFSLISYLAGFHDENMIGQHGFMSGSFEFKNIR